MANSGSYSMTCKFETSEDAVKFIVENSTKVPMPDMQLTGISMYGEYKYDSKTKKYDYTKRTYRVSLSWCTANDDSDCYGDVESMPVTADIN